MLLVGGVWAWFAVLDEVSTGTGKVIPSSREQVIQTLDGGILTELNVREGSKVQAGQVVARLDPTRSESNVGESQAKYRASLAASIRLTAEVNNQPLAFPDSLKAWPALLAEETRLYHSRKEQLSKSTRQLDESLKLVNSELVPSPKGWRKPGRRAMSKCCVFASRSRILVLKRSISIPAILLTRVNSCQKPMPTW